jgi:hypothetical protein
MQQDKHCVLQQEPSHGQQNSPTWQGTVAQRSGWQMLLIQRRPVQHESVPPLAGLPRIAIMVHW